MTAYARKARILVDRLNVHVGGPEGGIIGEVKKGEIVEVLRTYTGIQCDWLIIPWKGGEAYICQRDKVNALKYAELLDPPRIDPEPRDITQGNRIPHWVWWALGTLIFAGLCVGAIWR